MNFVLHFALAATESGSDEQGVGAMLPDLYRMASRGVRARRAGALRGPVPGALAELTRGVEHHLDADVWFHRLPVFVDGERRLRRRFADLAPRSHRLPLFAHAAWELCLDGAWLRAHGVDAQLARLGRALDAAADVHALARLHAELDDEAAFDARLVRIVGAIRSGALPAGYASAEGVAVRLGGMRAAFGIAPPAPEELAAWVDALDEAAREADEALAALLDARRVHLAT